MNSFLASLGQISTRHCQQVIDYQKDQDIHAMVKLNVQSTERVRWYEWTYLRGEGAPEDLRHIVDKYLEYQREIDEEISETAEKEAWAEKIDLFSQMVSTVSGVWLVSSLALSTLFPFFKSISLVFRVALPAIASVSSAYLGSMTVSRAKYQSRITFYTNRMQNYFKQEEAFKIMKEILCKLHPEDFTKELRAPAVWI
jgi:hypothetical protein